MSLVATLAYLLTAGVGVWAAYDRGAAQEKFVLLCVGLVAAHMIDRLGRQVGAQRREPSGFRLLGIAGLVCAGLAVVLGTLLWAPGREDGGIIAGALVVLLPLGVHSAVWLWRCEQRAAVGLVTIALSWALAMLLMTGEHSAWFALAVSGLVGLALWGLLGAGEERNRLWLASLLVVAVLAACIAMYILLLLGPGNPLGPSLGQSLGTGLGPLWGPSEAVQSRVALWQDALVLLQDYVFTGSGLNATSMVYSSYVYLMHVPYQPHMHNLYLEMAVEQGAPGLLAFMAMIAAVVCAAGVSRTEGHRRQERFYILPAIALAAMLVHGLFDSELYASRLAPLMFLPFGFLAAAGRLGAGQETDLFIDQETGGNRVVHGLMGLALLAILAALVVMPSVQAIFQANLGAVAQTRAELSLYSWPAWPIQDEVRRSGAVSLAQATEHYQAALALDPGNATAHRRLGQIALSLGDYDAARQHLETAFSRTSNQRVTRQLLGEVYAVTGHRKQAAELWRSMDIPAIWLKEREWWYAHIDAHEQARWLSQAASSGE